MQASHLQNDAEQIFDFVQIGRCFGRLCDTFIGCLTHPRCTCPQERWCVRVELIHCINTINMLITQLKYRSYEYLTIGVFSQLVYS